MKSFNGSVLFLDRSDINTDEIIPAKYLTEISKEALGPHLLEDLNLSGFNQSIDIHGKAAIVSRENFGCGSSREHAPWALEVNGINVVFAESFARIFRQNMYNCGMMAVELPGETINSLFEKFANRDGVKLELNFEDSRAVFSCDSEKEEVEFKNSEFDRELVLAGGWLDFAYSRY